MSSMQNNAGAFQDAVARAKQIAQKLSASAPNADVNSPLKRSNSDDDSSNKRPAFASPTQTNDIPTPVLRAQQIAQKINSQLGVKPTNNSPLPISASALQEDYKIPDRFVGLIIGKSGEQIIRLQADSGCKVLICQTRPDPIPGGPNPPDRIANLCGTREAIDRAKRLMDDIISKGRNANGGPITLNPYSLGGGGGGSTSTTIDVMLPSAKCGLVIGKGGENIKRLSEEFGVKLYVAQETTDIDGIEHKPLRIMGEADRIARAKQYVLDSLSKSGGLPMPSNRSSGNSSNSAPYNEYGSKASSAPITGPCNEATYHVPYEKAGVIIGKGGESIKEINRKSGAFVELDKNYAPSSANSSERVFKLRGTPDQIVQAQQLMYDKVVNSPGGPGDMLSPVEFQHKFNLPFAGISNVDTWNGNNNNQYGNGANSNDPYSQWANAYGQWPAQANSYGDSTSKNNNPASGTDPSAMGQMDPAWLAYYQSMGYYNMAQSNTTTPTTPTTASATTKPADSAANTAGQADYSQQWIEYYRSVGQNELADQIVQQMKESGSTTSTTNAAQTAAMNSWAAYAQQWANTAASNPTNTSQSSSTTSS